MKRHKQIGNPYELSFLCVKGAGWRWKGQGYFSARNTKIWNRIKKHSFRPIGCVEGALISYRGSIMKKHKQMGQSQNAVTKNWDNSSFYTINRDFFPKIYVNTFISIINLYQATNASLLEYRGMDYEEA